MKKLFVLLFSILIASTGFAQSKETIKKLKELKGEVEEITIKTDKDELTVKGEEAEELLEKLKEKRFAFWKDRGKFEFKVDTDKIKEYNEKILKKFRCKKDTNYKEIKIEFDGDKKKVSVIDKNGEEKVYVGNEAEEFIEEHLSENRFFHFGENDFEFDDDNVFFFDSDKDYDDLIIELDENDTDDVDIEIEINENGEKEVTVTEEKDGKEVTKKYVGKEADEFLKKRNKIMKLKVKTLKDDLDKLKKRLKVKKRIIIETEDED